MEHNTTLGGSQPSFKKYPLQKKRTSNHPQDIKKDIKNSLKVHEVTGKKDSLSI